MYLFGKILTPLCYVRNWNPIRYLSPDVATQRTSAKTGILTLPIPMGTESFTTSPFCSSSSASNPSPPVDISTPWELCSSKVYDRFTALSSKTTSCLNSTRWLCLFFAFCILFSVKIYLMGNNFVLMRYILILYAEVNP